ncbi:MAG: N-acetylglucosamine-6-phosphate deacetylase [Treponema sp.]|jgi:N-acetylglucosamine-6-phosphate deacetylase|nr:N-acetylglucosamine-6-phosphate deacetylase [Treponema sp.]
MQLLIKNSLILQDNDTFRKGQLGIDQGKIAALWYDEPPSLTTGVELIDAEGCLLSSGFIDTHNHGGNGFGYDSGSTGTEYDTGWGKLQEWLSGSGVTSILPTLESSPYQKMLNFIERNLALSEKNNSNSVEIVGVHLEGPYFNKSRKGMHQEQYIRPANKIEIKRILDKSAGLVKVWTLAPEIKENMSFIETLTAAGVSVSIGHTEADYDTAMKAFSAGANRVTHTFNTMPSLNQRYKGIITAAWQHGAIMELIADGRHVSPTIIKMFVSATDPGKVVLVSDNNVCSGLPEGSYMVHNRPLIVVRGCLETETGVLAGTNVGLNQCAFNLTRYGFSAGTALKMASENPARSIGIFDRKGSIAPGKDADLVILDNQFNVLLTIKGGRIVYRKNMR